MLNFRNALFASEKIGCMYCLLLWYCVNDSSSHSGSQSLYLPSALSQEADRGYAPTNWGCKPRERKMGDGKQKTQRRREEEPGDNHAPERRCWGQTWTGQEDPTGVYSLRWNEKSLCCIPTNGKEETGVELEVTMLIIRKQNINIRQKKKMCSGKKK